LFTNPFVIEAQTLFQCFFPCCTHTLVTGISSSSHLQDIVDICGVQCFLPAIVVLTREPRTNIWPDSFAPAARIPAAQCATQVDTALNGYFIKEVNGSIEGGKNLPGDFVKAPVGVPEFALQLAAFVASTGTQ
jgi:hypothetical protein